MEQKKTYILFFDIDGTLIDEETAVVPESTKKAIKMAKENGHYVFINTGRCKAIWPQELIELGFDGVVGGCGTHVEYHGDTVFHQELPQKLCKEIAKDLVTYHIDGVLEGKNNSYFGHSPFMPEVKKIIERGMYLSHTELRYWDDEEILYDKMALWFDKSSRMDLFKTKYEGKFDFIVRDPRFYEIVPKGCSKATGMKFLEEYLGIPHDNTVAIGDSSNDMPMFDYAPLSISLKTNRVHVLEAVDYVTDTVMNDGIYKALKHFEII